MKVKRSARATCCFGRISSPERPKDQLSLERDRRAEDVVEKFQWITAGTVFANPFPALELVANGAVQLQMISELAGVYGVQISSSHVRMIGGQMVQMLLKLGLVETATSLVAGIFKSSLVGYAAAGAVQAVSMAYLTHVSGEAFSEYFRQGQAWGDGGMQAALVRQFDLTSRAEFLQDFAKQAVQKVSTRLLQGPRPKRPNTLRRSCETTEMTILSNPSSHYPQLFPPPDQTIAGIGRALRERETSCVKILQSCLEQVDEWEPKVHAWVILDRDKALERASELDDELKAGNDRGPLHGIPIGIKDMIDVAGIPTACGTSKRWSTRPRRFEDASVVARFFGVQVRSHVVGEDGHHPLRVDRPAGHPQPLEPRAGRHRRLVRKRVSRCGGMRNVFGGDRKPDRRIDHTACLLLRSLLV